MDSKTKRPQTLVYHYMLQIPDILKPFVKIKHSKTGPFDIYTYTVIPTDPDGAVPKRHRYNVLDDNTYLKYPELIKLVPRGLSIAFLGGTLACALDGLEKFDGSCPLDDDNECSGNIFKQYSADIINWTNLKVEFLEKANGKMAIFKVFKVPDCDTDRYYILGGSKNVHVVIGIDQDIEGQYDLQYQMLRVFQKDISGIDPEILVGHTIIGEYVDGKHIVYTDDPYMVYFSGPVGLLGVGGLLEPLRGVKRLMPDQNTLPTVEQLRSLRNLENTEGTVIVYTNLDTGLVFRQKHKTIWYILIRVMREGLRHFNRDSDNEIIVNKVFTIFKKRSDDFLNLTDDQLDKWRDTLLKFVVYIKQSVYSFSDLDPQKKGIAKVWNLFIAYTNATDRSITDQKIKDATGD